MVVIWDEWVLEMVVLLKKRKVICVLWDIVICFVFYFYNMKDELCYVIDEIVEIVFCM